MEKRLLLFFPCDGKVGGAERRLCRCFSEIARTHEDFSFEIALLATTRIDAASIISLYGSFTNSTIHIFKNMLKFFIYVFNSKHNYVCYTDCSIRCLPVLFGGLLSRKKRIMLCTDFYGSSHNLGSYIKQVIYNLDVLLSSRIDCLYPTNTELLRKQFPRKKITCTPGSFTDMDKYHPLFPKKNVIIFLGRLIELKGILVFLEAAISIANVLREKNYVCEIYGHGKLHDYVKKRIKESCCSDVIVLKGHIDDSSIILPTSKIFCSVQLLGNYPSQSLLEAISCGNYCIVTDGPDTEYIVRDKFAVVVKPDVKEIANALVNTIKNLQLDYNEIAFEGRKFLKENHSIEKSSNHFYSLFN